MSLVREPKRGNFRLFLGANHDRTRNVEFFVRPEQHRLVLTVPQLVYVRWRIPDVISMNIDLAYEHVQEV